MSSQLRRIVDWDRIEPVVMITRLEDQPPEAWFWRDICVEDRLEAVERLRRRQHHWEAGREPALERVARIVEFT